jgi:hypothetical protein
VVAAGWPGPARHVAELKWCQAGDDKVYEAIWDLFKMALALRLPGMRTAHLITGAPVEMWPRAFCADLFAGGTFTVEELCARRFARGGRRFAWDYLPRGRRGPCAGARAGAADDAAGRRGGAGRRRLGAARRGGRRGERPRGRPLRRRLAARMAPGGRPAARLDPPQASKRQLRRSPGRP